MNKNDTFAHEALFPESLTSPDRESRPSKEKWKVMIVDDEESVHAVTRMVLADFTFEGKGIEFICAHSAAEAKQLLGVHPDLAIILLDVVMEQDNSGLLLAHHIREVLGNRQIRIILRTGMPGMAPLEKVIVDYDIHDYTEKTDLTDQKLFTIVISALRSYRDIMASVEMARRLEEEIAERREAEEKLRASEKIYSDIFTNIGIGISIINPKMEIVFLNPVMERMNPHIDVGKKPLCYRSFNTPPRDDVCSYCPTIKTFADGQVHISVTDTPTPQGVRHFRVISAPVFTAEGDITAVVEAVEDITEHKHAGDALRQKEIYLKGILESTADGILAIDENGKVIKANRKFAQLWKIPDSMILEGDDEALLNFVLDQLQDPDGFLKKVRSLYGRRDTDMDNLYFKDGRVFERYSAPLVEDGAIIGRVWSFRDITEKRKMEEDILRAQKMESVGLLAGGIAHDFNNLLTAILGNISLAKAQLPGEDRAQKRLFEAEKASLRARDLTQQLLTFAKGGSPLRRSSSVSDLIRDTVGFALSGSNVRCEFDIPTDLHNALIDQGQISQVIHNLVLNADQAMPLGGELLIRCCETSVSPGEFPSLREGLYIRIDIIDRGVGIPPEHLAKIFDPFFTTKEKGRGIGLATAFSIISNHEGQISVASEQGKGTVFTIHLPICSEKPDEKDDDVTPVTEGTGRILVMDDEDSVLDIAGEILAHLGYQSECAGDGEMAVEMFREAREAGNPFIAVIADLTIPGGMGGREMAVRLREIDPEIKVIVSSGYSNDPVLSDYRSYGFCGVISKPYLTEEVSKALADALG